MLVPIIQRGILPVVSAIYPRIPSNKKTELPVVYKINFVAEYKPFHRDQEIGSSHKKNQMLGC